MVAPLYKKSVDQSPKPNKPENLRPVEELEIFPLVLERVLVNPYEGSTVLLNSDGKMFALSLNPAEGTALTFARAGLAEFSHVKTIHQMYLATMKEIGTTLESVTLESQQGDVLYCRLAWCDRKHRRAYALCSMGDALVLHALSGAPLQVVSKVLDSMESCNDWVYENEILDDDEMGY